MKSVQWKLLVIAAVTGLSILSFYWYGLNLGLDLKGGVHLVLRVQTDDALRLETETTVERLRDTLTRGGIQFGKLEMRDAKAFVIDGITNDGAFRTAAVDVDPRRNTMLLQASGYSYDAQNDVWTNADRRALDGGIASSLDEGQLRAWIATGLNRRLTG